MATLTERQEQQQSGQVVSSYLLVNWTTVCGIGAF